MTDSTPRPTTLGELRTSGWRDRTVKEELRHNVIERLRRGEELFPGILGFEDTVLPALERALLAGHDIVLLGERGQAKTRLIRALVDLLDPALPTIAGGEVNDSPYDPVSAHAIAQVAELGDATPIAWLPRERRYGEKLATPDTSVADLIGDVDPIRVAEGRYLSDEFVIHYGLVPRTNRGIFSINELPDLPARIQVALFNVLEERDVQIRGFQVRMPIDLMLVATANPEDYTNRGRIITPLKDRFGSEIRTHYPVDPAHEIEIMEQEARPAGRRRGSGPRVHGGDPGRVLPPGPALAAHQPTGRRLGAAFHRQLGDRRRVGGAAGDPLWRGRGRAPHLRPAGHPAELRRPHRVRDLRRGPQGRHPDAAHGPRRARGLRGAAPGSRVPLDDTTLWRRRASRSRRAT